MERKKASDYPQELLNLFDRYVHGELDRRGFLEGAKKFAVGGMTATAIWERSLCLDAVHALRLLAPKARRMPAQGNALGIVKSKFRSALKGRSKLSGSRQHQDPSAPSGRRLI